MDIVDPFGVAVWMQVNVVQGVIVCVVTWFSYCKAFFYNVNGQKRKLERHRESKRGV